MNLIVFACLLLMQVLKATLKGSSLHYVMLDLSRDLL